MAESEASLDEQLELKKRARRRLVGATALALLAAIVLPMVMDHEPRPVNQDIQVRIPSQDGGGFTSRIMPAKPAATPLPPVAAEAKPEPKSELKSESKSEPKPEAKAETTTEPKSEAAHDAAKSAAPAPAAKAADKPSAKAAAKADDKPAAKPQEKPAADKKAEAARAADALSGGAAEHWVVQLGAYKDAGNVKLLLSKLKGIGLPAYTEKFDSPQGSRTRVRAGPFASKDAAEKAHAKLKIIGVDGPVAPK